MKAVQASLCAGVIAGSLLGMAACGSAGSSGGAADLITPDQAKAVAMAHLQKPTQSATIADEVGSLRAIDQAGQALSPAKTPEPTQDPGIMHSVTVWVAHQSSYPLSFVCFDAPTATQGTALPVLLFFNKPTRSAPWSVSYQIFMNGMSAAPDVALDSGGYARVFPRARYGSLFVAPTQLANDYATYLTAGSSADTHEFAPGSYTSQVVDADNRNIRNIAQQKQETVTVTGAPTGDPVVAYLLNDGGAVVLFGTRVTTHAVATKAPITITHDGKGIAAPAPGRYRDTTAELLLLVAFIDPPRGSGDRLTGIGAFGGTVRATGTPA